MKKGYIIDVQDFSVNDGDGIRTTIFFAGCPLRCAWCSNPEGFTTMNKVMHIEKSCIKCGRCVDVCPRGVGINLNLRHEREKCNGCGLCVKACPTGSRQNMIHEYTAQDLFDKTKKYFNFFRKSGGGVTFSGGECTLQLEFLTELVDMFYDYNVNMAMETSAYFDFEKTKEVIKKIDTIFIDIKHMDNKKHKYFTGKDNKLILDNIKKVAEIHDNIIIRVPLILSVNADKNNIEKTAEFVAENIKNPKIELLPYHTFGDLKYETLNITKPSELFKTPEKELMNELKEIISSKGVQNVSYR